MDLIHAHAAGAEIPVAGIEQLLRRRIVHIDAEGRRKIDLDRSHGIFLAGLLPKMIAVSCRVRPVDRGRIDLWTADPVEHANVQFLKMSGVFYQRWDDVFFDDAGGRVPIWIEIDVADLG